MPRERCSQGFHLQFILHLLLNTCGLLQFLHILFPGGEGGGGLFHNKAVL